MPTLPYSSPLGPTIETARLILRPPAAADFDGFCAFHADEQAMTYLGGVISPPIVWRTMRSLAGAWALDGFCLFSVIEKTSGEWIGRIGPLYPHGWPGREVGWGLRSEWWGKGYAKEAAIACIDYVFDELDWEQVIHTINPGNTGSIAVAKSLGSYSMGAGKFPDPYADQPCELWGQTRDEWLVNRRRFEG